MPPRQQRNEAFFAPASGEQALQKMLIAARETGQCNLRGRQLTELPSACLDINSVVLPEGGAPPRGRSGRIPHVRSPRHTHRALAWCGGCQNAAPHTHRAFRGVVAARAVALHMPTRCGSSHAGAWWDCRETLEKLDVSQNELSALPELASLPELRELLLSHNQLQLLPSLAVREST